MAPEATLIYVGRHIKKSCRYCLTLFVRKTLGEYLADILHFRAWLSQAVLVDIAHGLRNKEIRAASQSKLV